MCVNFQKNVSFHIDGRGQNQPKFVQRPLFQSEAAGAKCK